MKHTKKSKNANDDEDDAEKIELRREIEEKVIEKLKETKVFNYKNLFSHVKQVLNNNFDLITFKTVVENLFERELIERNDKNREELIILEI